MIAYSSAKVVAAALVLSVFASGCLKTEKFPVEPSIEFKSFEQFGDSASLVVKFTDGDGDIGLDPGDTLAPFDQPPYNSNLFVEYFELQDGAWVKLNLTLPLYYRIPVITPTGQNKTLDGELSIALDPFPTNPFGAYDTVMYSVQLADRALHLSNVVETGMIVTP